MSFDESKSFEVRNGFKLKKGAGFYSGVDSPVGNQATEGSLYLRTNGEEWKKEGPLDTDWVLKNIGNITGCFGGRGPSYTYAPSECIGGESP